MRRRYGWISKRIILFSYFPVDMVPFCSTPMIGSSETGIQVQARAQFSEAV